MNIIQFDSHGNSLFSYSAVNFIYRNMFENLPILTRCVLSFTGYDSKHFKYNKKTLISRYMYLRCLLVNLDIQLYLRKVLMGKS